MRFFAKFSLTVLLCFYLAILTKLVLFKYIPITEILNITNFGFNENRWNSINFIPFKTIKLFWYAENLNLIIRVENLAGNILGFVPFGFILPLLSKKLQKLVVVTIATLILSLSYEVLQFLTGLGSFDVDDLILNTLGGILGYTAFKMVHMMMKDQKRNQTNKTSAILRYFLN